jgi:hypothetical protein
MLECPHGNALSQNCVECSIQEHHRKIGIVGPDNVVHANNGAGYCVGCLTIENRCTVLVRYCPVLNTAKEISKHKVEDKKLILKKKYETILTLEKELDKARRELSVLESMDEFDNKHIMAVRGWNNG